MSRLIKLAFVSCIACSISISTVTNAVQSSNFAEYKKLQQKKYKQFKNDYLDRYEKYRKEIKEKWGVAELSSTTEYVHYNEENKTKVLTDFENDTIEVSILAADNLSDNEIDKIIREAIIDSLDKQPEIITNNQVEFDTVNHKVTDDLSSVQSDIIANSQVERPTVDNNKNNNSIPPITSTPTILNHLGITSPEKLTSLLKKVEVIPEKQQEKIIIKRTQIRLEKQIASLDNFSKNDDVAVEQIQASKALIVSMQKEKKVITHDANELTKKNIKTYKINLKRDRYKKAEQYLSIVEKNALKWQLSDQFILAIPLYSWRRCKYKNFRKEKQTLT